MVKLVEASDPDKLETLLNNLCAKFKYKLFITGWTRKTYDIFHQEPKLSPGKHIARIESISMDNGELRYYDEQALKFITELAENMEKIFKFNEAIIIRENRPEY